MAESTPAATTTTKIENMAARNSRKRTVEPPKRKTKKGLSKGKVISEKTVEDLFRIQYSTLHKEARDAHKQKDLDNYFEEYAGRSMNMRGVFRCVASRAVMQRMVRRSTAVTI